MIRKYLIAAATAGLFGAQCTFVVLANPLPTTWSGLVQVKGQNVKAVYLLPGANFRAYRSVMLDPTEVDFVDGWVRKMNTKFTLGRTSDADAVRIAEAVREGFAQRWQAAFAKAAWQVVSAAGPDVLRIRTMVFNLSISTPFSVTRGMGTVRSVDAGGASILVEVRDSETGAVLGSFLDSRRAGENTAFIPRSTVSNKSDFGRLFNQWSEIAVNGLARLKALSPVDANAQTIRN